MDHIKVRYVESFDLSIETDDETATIATLFVGNAGEIPVITIPAQFENGVAYITGLPADTRVPLGDYRYQVNVSFSDGRVLKYPTDEYCEENGLPGFSVLESLDETEVVS